MKSVKEILVRALDVVRVVYLEWMLCLKQLDRALTR